MNRIGLTGLAVLTVALFAMPSLAQDAMQKGDSSKATPSESQIVLAQWNEIGKKLIVMAEDFPEEKYDYKPTPAVRSFAEQLLHAAGSMYYFTSPAQGQTPPGEDPPRAKYKTKADVVAYVRKAVEDGAAVIKSKADKGMNDLVTDPETKQKTPVYAMAYGLIEHSGEHYGQLVVYYRLSGLVPPESRPKK
ncbi:MAG TPA: DinB family protein [Candidatus Acidoferrum sp.]